MDDTHPPSGAGTNGPENSPLIPTQAVERCNLCGSTQYHVRFYKEPYTRVQCDDCGLVWSKEQPSAARLSDMYSESYFRGDTYLDYVRDQAIIELNAHKRLKIIHRYTQPPGTVLDIGCAAGFFLNVCRQAGWKATGVELSGYASAYARDRLGLDVYTGTLVEANHRAGSAQLVTLWDVIEHVADPRETFSQAAALLQPGGLLALSTGDIESLLSHLLGRSWRLITYDHLYYFSVRTIRRYIETAGLEIIAVHRDGRLVSPELLAHMLFNNYINVPPGIRHSVIRLAGLMPSFPLNFWDVITVYAYKPNRHIRETS